MERNDPAPPSGTPTPATCNTCHGTKGHTETTTETRAGRTVTSQTWRPCGPCNGTGKAPQ